MRSARLQNTKYNIQKSIVFLYTSNEQPEHEIKRIIQFTITSKRMKYLTIYLQKEVQDMYTENYFTLLKETKEDLINGKKFHVHGPENLILLR